MSAAPLVAVDGGNSKTDLALFSADGTVLATVRGPGSNPHMLGIDGALDVVERLLDAAWHDAEPAPPGGLRGVAAAGAFFLAGADQPDEEAALTRAVAARGWVERELVANDMLALLWAGTSDGWGVAVGVGAGINCIGRAESGATARFGALGAVTGDWGGGGDIGLAAVGAAVRAEDGRGPDTALKGAVTGHFGEKTAMDVALGFHEHRYTWLQLGELSPLVFDAANAGDGEAESILTRQADEVVRFANAALRRAGLTDGPVEVVLGGAVLIASPPRMLDRIRAAIAAVAPAATVAVCRSRPLVGAAAAALRMAGGGSEPERRLRRALDDASPRTVSTA